jgi:hypothetical protein
LIMAGWRESPDEHWTEEQLQTEIERELKNGGKAKEISSRLALQSGWTKKEIYSLVNRSSAEKK